MGAASLGVILDSSVVIEAERPHLNSAQFLKHIIQMVGEMEVGLSRPRPRTRYGNSAHLIGILA